MHFAYAETILRPKHLELLTCVLDQVCPLSDDPTSEHDREEVANRLLRLFRAGIREKSTLAELARPTESTREAS